MDARVDPSLNAFSQAAPPLSLCDIRFSVDGKAILRGVSLSVQRRQVLCLLGPSGCGKTTLLRIAAGIERQSAGTVSVAGEPVADERVFLPAERRDLGFVFQDLALFPHMSVADNVAYGLRRTGKLTRDIVSDALAQVGLAGRERAYPHELSGGEQQRVALVRALLPAPKVVLFDEPFSGLDRGLRESVREDVLAVLREREATAVIVTHDPEEALSMADTIALMRAGRVVQVASPDEIWRHPVDLGAAKAFSRVNTFEGRANGGAVETPVGQAPANGHMDGTRLTVGFRPGDIRVFPPGHTGGVPATVVRRRFYGTHVELTIGVSGTLINVRTEPHMAVEGQDVRLGADLARAIVVPAEDNA